MKKLLILAMVCQACGANEDIDFSVSHTSESVAIDSYTSYKLKERIRTTGNNRYSFVPVNGFGDCFMNVTPMRVGEYDVEIDHDCKGDGGYMMKNQYEETILIDSEGLRDVSNLPENRSQIYKKEIFKASKDTAYYYMEILNIFTKEVEVFEYFYVRVD